MKIEIGSYEKPVKALPLPIMGKRLRIWCPARAQEPGIRLRQQKN